MYLELIEVGINAIVMVVTIFRNITLEVSEE